MKWYTQELRHGRLIVTEAIHESGEPVITLEYQDNDGVTQAIDMPTVILDRLIRERHPGLWTPQDVASMFRDGWWGDSHGRRVEITTMDPRYALHVRDFILNDAPNYYFSVLMIMKGNPPRATNNRWAPGWNQRAVLAGTNLVKALNDRIDPPSTLETRALDAAQSRGERWEAERVSKLKQDAIQFIRDALSHESTPDDWYVAPGRTTAETPKDHVGLHFSYVHRSVGGAPPSLFLIPRPGTVGSGSGVAVRNLAHLGEHLHHGGLDRYMWNVGFV